MDKPVRKAVRCYLIKDNKVVVTKYNKGNKKEGYYDIPGGKIENGELLKQTAIREVFEETGCTVKLKGILPIVSVKAPSGETHVLVRFIAEIVDENIKFDTDEILEVKWIDINEIKNMSINEIRGYDTTKKLINDFENNNVYSLDIISDLDFPNG